MVKIGLNVKNGSKIMKPKQGDVIIYDGKDWYVTTKDDIFREYQLKVDNKLKEINEKLCLMEEYKREISSQMTTMSDAIKNFIQLQGDN